MRTYLCARKIYSVSVIIPMYNAEEFIGECLESLLIQTFQNFEVIVVDDCSTDNSVAIVKNYSLKFGNRLILTHTEKNSGGGGEPRNIGLSLANGEYIQFLDADDFILLTALETLYNVAKEYDADIVCENSYYLLDKPNNISLYRDGLNKKLLKENREDKMELLVDNPKENLNRLLLIDSEGNFYAAWSKFFRREFMLENEITFPQLPNSQDFLMVINAYCRAKRLLRIPTPLVFYRHYNTSVTRKTRTHSGQISYWFLTFVDFVKHLHKIAENNKVLSENPDYLLSTLRAHFRWCLSRTDYARKSLSNQEIYEILNYAFAKTSSNFTGLLMPFFFSTIVDGIKDKNYNEVVIRKFKNYLSARVDFKLMKNDELGELQVISVSDEKALVKKASWLPKNESGYFVQSYNGSIEIVTKATVGGKMQLDLKGLDIRNPDDKSRRTPYWIDYTKLSINDKVIFDKVTSAWHDKPYRYSMEVKADEEIKIQVEWQPHRFQIKPLRQLT